MTLPYLEHVRLGTERFVEAVRRDPTAHIPSCPEWNVDELVRHVYGVFHFWAEVADKTLQDPRGVDRSAPADEGEELLESVTTESERLIGILERTDPSTRIWTWARDKTVGFLPRRMAHEIAIHAWDAENATGTGQDIEADLAWDGVREYFDHFYWNGPHRWEGGPGRVELRRSDVEDVEIVQLAGDHLQPDAVVTGHPSHLDLLVWGRTGLERVTIEGDAELVRAFLASGDRE